MDALRLVYPQYLLKSSCETFFIHLALLKGFYCQPWKLGSNQTWILQFLMWTFSTYNVFFLRSQWNLMHNGLVWTNLWIWILCLGFGKIFLLMHYYVPVLMSSWRRKIGCDSLVLWRMKGLFQHWHLWKQDFKSSLWTFGFGGLYVCTTFLYGWYFPLWWSMPSQHGLKKKHIMVIKW